LQSHLNVERITLAVQLFMNLIIMKMLSCSCRDTTIVAVHAVRQRPSDKANGLGVLSLP